MMIEIMSPEEKILALFSGMLSVTLYPQQTPAHRRYCIGHS